jgi:hypothetical protein
MALQFYDTVVSLPRNKQKPLKMRKLAMIFAAFLLLGTASKAQQVSGTIKDDQGKGVDKATISLLNAKDLPLPS